MPGETDLGRLLESLSPRLLPQEYIFCCLDNPKPEVIELLEPLATFREEEGSTLVITRAQADAEQLPYDVVLRCISLGAHSSLEAIGLTAAVSGALAEKGISANVIAAFHHDHLFVPTVRAQEALATLEALSSS